MEKEERKFGKFVQSLLLELIISHLFSWFSQLQNKKQNKTKKTVKNKILILDAEGFFDQTRVKHRHAINQP